MTILYVVLLATVAAAFAGMFWLRRVADRSWRRHQILRPLVKDWIQFQIVLVDRLTPALREMAAAVERMAPAMERFGKALREDKK